MGLVENFWEHVSMPDGCWEWQGSQVNGYGKIQINGQKLSAHRVAWELRYGPIPEGIFVLHRCDNPGCVRPDHLFLGRQVDNVHDMVAKGRARGGGRQGSRHGTYKHGSAHHKAKLTESDVLAIRAAYQPGTVSYDALAIQYGVTKQNIRAIVKGTTWQHLLPS